MVTTAEVDTLAKEVLAICSAPVTHDDVTEKLNEFIHDFDINDHEVVVKTAELLEAEHVSEGGVIIEAEGGGSVALEPSED